MNGKRPRGRPRKYPKAVENSSENKVTELFSVRLPDDQDERTPDLVWSINAAKKIYRQSDEDTIRLKAIDTVLKAISLKASKPELAEIKEESEEEVLDFSKMSAEELSRLYREKLG